MFNGSKVAPCQSLPARVAQGSSVWWLSSLPSTGRVSPLESCLAQDMVMVA